MIGNGKRSLPFPGLEKPRKKNEKLMLAQKMKKFEDEVTPIIAFDDKSAFMLLLTFVLIPFVLKTMVLSICVLTEFF